MSATTFRTTMLLGALVLACAAAGCAGTCPEPGAVTAETVPGCAGIRVHEFHPSESCLGPEVVINVEPPSGPVVSVKELPTCVADASGRLYVPRSQPIGDAAEAGVRPCTTEEREVLSDAARSGLFVECGP